MALTKMFINFYCFTLILFFNEFTIQIYVSVRRIFKVLLYLSLQSILQLTFFKVTFLDSYSTSFKHFLGFRVNLWLSYVLAIMLIVLVFIVVEGVIKVDVFYAVGWFSFEVVVCSGIICCFFEKWWTFLNQKTIIIFSFGYQLNKFTIWNHFISLMSIFFNLFITGLIDKTLLLPLFHKEILRRLKRLLMDCLIIFMLAE